MGPHQIIRAIAADLAASVRPIILVTKKLGHVFRQRTSDGAMASTRGPVWTYLAGVDFSRRKFPSRWQFVPMQIGRICRARNNSCGDGRLGRPASPERVKGSGPSATY